MIPGVHINVILTMQLQMKPQRKKKPRYSTETNVVTELIFKGRCTYKPQTLLALPMAGLSMALHARKH